MLPYNRWGIAEHVSDFLEAGPGAQQLGSQRMSETVRMGTLNFGQLEYCR
jgi:hypothetical protein